MSLMEQPNQFPNRRRKSRVIPFGYKQSESDDKTLEPIQNELEALEQAKIYLENSSYREVADWLYRKTGRKVTGMGLRKILNRKW